MTATKSLARGGQRAADRIAEEKAARQSGFNNDYEWFSLKAPANGESRGESIFVRFVTDEPEWIRAKQHSFIPTKPAPKDLPEGYKWRDKADSTCRYTENEDEEPIYDYCYVCEDIKVPGKNKQAGKMVKPFPSTKLWAVGVEREPVIGTQAMVDEGKITARQVGKPVNYRDVMIEKEDGTKVKKFLVFNQSMSNFFDHLLGAVDVYDTVVDRDFKITRLGGGTDTDYNIQALDPVKDPESGEILDLRQPEFAEQYKMPFNLLEIVLDRASDEYYEWLFDARVESSYVARFGKKDDSAASADDADESPSVNTSKEESSEVPNLDLINGMKGRLKAKANAAQDHQDQDD